MVNSSTLMGYAMLKANFNEGSKSFLDSFLPFVVDSVRSNHPNPTGPDEVSAYVNDTFGLDIPSAVARGILSRAKATGLLKKSDNGKYSCTTKELKSGTSVSASFDSFVRQQNQLSDHLLRFALEKFPEIAESLNREQCAKLIAEYMNEHSLPLLQSGVRGSALNTRSIAATENFLVSEFVATAYESSPEIFNLLVEVAKGATLAAVLKMDVSSLEASLSDLWVYLDTSIVLALLGYHGESEQAAASEVLKIGSKLGVKMCTFGHTVSEVRGILYAAQTTIRSGTRVREGFKVAEYFIESDQTAADIELSIEHLDRDITLLGLLIRDKPAEYHQFGLDESELDRLIAENINYQSDSGRRYDVDSIAAVHQLRQGKGGEKLERARALFVTRNRQLVIAANKARESKQEFPLALLEPSFASLLWVRRPSLAADLPEKRVLATAWAGMQPEPGRWLEYLAEADRLVQRGELSPEDALLLRVSNVGRHELMRSTEGDPEKFKEIKPTALLERLKHDLSMPLQFRIKELEEKNKANSDSAKAVVDSATSELEAVTQALQDSVQQNAHLRSEQSSQRTRLFKQSHRSATLKVRWLWILAAFTILLIGIGLQIAPVFFEDQAAVPLTILILGAAFVVGSSVLPFTPFDTSRFTPQLVRKFAKRSFQKKLVRTGLRDTSEIEVDKHLENLAK